MQVEGGLDAVKPGHVISQPAQIGREGRGAADAFKQQIGRRVVAPGYGGIAQGGDGHARRACVVLGDGRPGDEVGLAMGDAPVELLVAILHAREDEGCGERLEGAHEQEAFIGAMAGGRARGGIKDGDAETPTMPGLQRRKIRVELRRARRGSGPRGGGWCGGEDRASQDGGRKGLAAGRGGRHGHLLTRTAPRQAVVISGRRECAGKYEESGAGYAPSR